jgi:2-iminobutanoate/2-iminopropanoate deaminase
LAAFPLSSADLRWSDAVSPHSAIARPAAILRTLRFRATVLSTALAACSGQPAREPAGATGDKQIISPPGATRIAPYSSAVRAGGFVFFSGVIGTLPDSRELAPGGTPGEMRQVFDNLRGIMDAAGVRADDIIKCTVFLADIAEFEAMNEVYGSFFATDPPARTTVGGAALPLGARVELDCIAAA